MAENDNHNPMTWMLRAHGAGPAGKSCKSCLYMSERKRFQPGMSWIEYQCVLSTVTFSWDLNAVACGCYELTNDPLPAEVQKLPAGGRTYPQPLPEGKGEDLNGL